MPDPLTLSAFYEDHRYLGGGHQGHGYEDYQGLATEHRKSLLRRDFRLEKLEELLPGRGRMLDVGCGNGYRLSVAAEAGWSCVGVEPSAWAVEQGRERFGLDLRQGTLEDASPEGPFDAIMLEDVLEHVPRPRELLSQAEALLAPGGVVVVNLPNFGSRRVKLRGPGWNEVRPPEHLTYLSRSSLDQLGEELGLTVVWSSRHPRYQVPAEELRSCLPGALRILLDGLDGGPAAVVTDSLQHLFFQTYDQLLQYPKLLAMLSRTAGSRG
jgi:SAM-dependent methyltransferase